MVTVDAVVVTELVRRFGALALALEIFGAESLRDFRAMIAAVAARPMTTASPNQIFRAGPDV